MTNSLKSPLLFLAPAMVISVAGSAWLLQVHRVVPEPYLDEVFHVRQAQVYCDGHFDQWDPKITTPPGVYLLSYLAYLLTNRCDIWSLRLLNCVTLSLIAGLTSVIAMKIRRLKLRDTSVPVDAVESKASLAIHTGINVCLFPPLFFFSALYYTDPTSTLMVLLSYWLLLDAGRHEHVFSKSATLAFSIGVFALLFRQTNIFWVALFAAGSSVVDCLKQRSTKPSADQRSTRTTSFLGICQYSWEDSQVHDCAVEDAYFEDYIKTFLSIVIVALRNALDVVSTVIPYVALICIFGAFVVWNGGVVLGDKSNHVATVHITQMLYLWPYMAFFSFPLLLPLIIGSVVARLPSIGPLAYLQRKFPFSSLDLPRYPLVLGAVLLGLLTVYYNTIVHPFTLADNRHYVFYVFRILLRHPAVKYLVVPLYIKLGWVAIRALGYPGYSSSASKKDRRPAAKRSTGETTETGDLPRDGCCVSFVIVWLATTALSVMTAPLVEPRYFIIPWVVWRLNLPMSAAMIKNHKGLIDMNSLLWLETAWFLLINGATGYMFLHRGFSWPQEPGKVQRFMW